jgi:hypothetical protein
MSEPTGLRHQPAAKTPSALSGTRLQRKCACGQHTPGGGECEECKKKRLLQREVVGSPGSSTDPDEFLKALRDPGLEMEETARGLMAARLDSYLSRPAMDPDCHLVEMLTRRPAAQRLLLPGARAQALERLEERAEACRKKAPAAEGPEEGPTIDLPSTAEKAAGSPWAPDLGPLKLTLELGRLSAEAGVSKLLEAVYKIPLRKLKNLEISLATSNGKSYTFGVAFDTPGLRLAGETEIDVTDRSGSAALSLSSSAKVCEVKAREKVRLDLQTKGFLLNQAVMEYQAWDPGKPPEKPEETPKTELDYLKAIAEEVKDVLKIAVQARKECEKVPRWSIKAEGEWKQGMPKPFDSLEESKALLKLELHHNLGMLRRRPRHEKRKGKLQRSALRSIDTEEAPPIVHEVLQAAGQPLDAAARSFLEPRFGDDLVRLRTGGSSLAQQGALAVTAPGDPFEREADTAARQALQGAPSTSGLGRDFSRVRVHSDARAAASAQAVGARAYTVGEHIVFGAGELAPHTAPGMHLLAHELAHVVQQDGAGTRSLQRFQWNPLAWFGIMDASYNRGELQDYLKKLDERNAVEGKFYSDDKARAIAKSWSNGEGVYVLTARRKALLIREMLDGVVLRGDQKWILNLLERSENAELDYIFGPGGVRHETLLKEFGSWKDELYRFYRRRFSDAFPDDTNKIIMSSEEPAGKPDFKKLLAGGVVASGTRIQPGDKLPETSNPFYDAVKAKETKRRTDVLSKQEADAWVLETYGAYIAEEKKLKGGKGFIERKVGVRVDASDTSQFVDFLAYCRSLKIPMPQCEVDERTVHAFYDSSVPEIVVRGDREAPEDRLHEAVHAYSDDKAREDLPRYAMEGMTEYFTRQIILRHGQKAKKDKLAIGSSYSGPYQAIEELALTFGEPLLAKVLFQGEVKALCEAMGKKTFDQWSGHMESKDEWQEAVRVVRQRPTGKSAAAQGSCS